MADLKWACSFQTYAETPTSPAEFCENDAEDGEDFCTDHLDMEDGVDPDEARDRALDYEMGLWA